MHENDRAVATPVRSSHQAFQPGPPENEDAMEGAHTEDAQEEFPDTLVDDQPTHTTLGDHLVVAEEAGDDSPPKSVSATDAGDSQSDADSLADLPVPPLIERQSYQPDSDGEPETPVPFTVSLTGPGALWYDDCPAAIQENYNQVRLYPFVTPKPSQPKPSQAKPSQTPSLSASGAPASVPQESPMQEAQESPERRALFSPTTVVNDDGTVSKVKVEPDDIPALGDEYAVQPELGAPQLSPGAISQRARRIFTPRANGTLKVSKKIFDEWHGKSKERRTLEEIFKRCGYDPDLGLPNTSSVPGFLLECIVFFGSSRFSLRLIA